MADEIEIAAVEPERFTIVRVTSLAGRPTFLVSGQCIPRAEFIDEIIGYLFDEEDATWEIVKSEPVVEPEERARAAAA